MTTVTGLTAERMLAIEAASVIDGDIVGDNLILTKHDGTTIDAGNVRGPQGDPGPASSTLSVISATPVLDIGIANQIRAGRQLIAADFTNMELSAPIGLWNLTDTTDASGNARSLTNKGAVPSAIGINGGAATCMRFNGSTTQALFISDTGANDPFRIKTGSWGAWFRAVKRGANTTIMGKMTAASGNYCWQLLVDTSGALAVAIYFDGANQNASLIGVVNVADDRWHFGVATYDGNDLRLYLDGMFEAEAASLGVLYSGASPFNIGGYGADGGTATANPFFGRIDEVFVTSDILSEEQIRNLYCAKITHALGSAPAHVVLNVRRLRRGAALVAGDFTTQPLRLHNFSAGALTDAGSHNISLANTNAVKTASGADGTAGNAFFFSGSNQYLSAADNSMPAALTARSYGCWFKVTAGSTVRGIMGWGTASTGEAAAFVNTDNTLMVASAADGLQGPFVADGLWHFMVVVESNTPNDGIKRKLFIDGSLVGTSLVLNSITLAGANGFKVGISQAGTGNFTGSIDTAFVCGYAMTADEVRTLFIKSSQALPPSPKNSGDHVEAMSSTDLLVLFDGLEPQHQVDIGVAA